MKQKFAFLLATGFGLGRIPLAPGTAGCLLGAALSFGLAILPWPVQLAASLALAAAAVPVCSLAEAAFGVKDDPRIVADEYLTFPLCTVGLPILSYPFLLAAAFLANRCLDILKPPPARRVQNLRGGTGIVLDDVVSALYALIVNHAIAMVLKLE